MRKEDNRFDTAVFLLVSAFSFLVFSSILFLLQNNWNKPFLYISTGLAIASLLSFLVEKIYDRFFREKED